jgi:hypothetical protein
MLSPGIDGPVARRERGRLSPLLRSLLLLAVSAPTLASCSAQAPVLGPPEPSPATTAPATVTKDPERVPTAAPARAEAGAPLPAGLCSFPGYLSNDAGCEGAAAMTHAVLLGDVHERAAAEALVVRWVGKLAPGYPMVLASSELPLDHEDTLAPESARRAPGGRHVRHGVDRAHAVRVGRAPPQGAEAGGVLRTRAILSPP